ncbi:PCYT2 [Branchiostoma lanceolatum]|nr:PCYT2 [Branchiostoma lanceolatum]
MATASESATPRKVRVWMDGCFDMVHFGHANALRQAKKTGDVLVVGVHSDDAISKYKGPPVWTEQERYKMIRAIKWVDEVVEDASYFPTPEQLDKYGCDFCVHGDDISTTVDGEDCYSALKNGGRYRTCSRTQGISTTDLVGRMLLMTRDHHRGDTNGAIDNQEFAELNGGENCPWTGVSQFIASTQKILEFSSGTERKQNDRAVYIPGSFDLFHCGHLDFLERARQEGDYLIIGLHGDAVVNWYKGCNHPIMNIHERVLTLLACKYVSEVVIDAPYKITEEMMEHLSIDMVCHGKPGSPVPPCKDGGDPFAVPKALGKFKMLDSGNELTTTILIDRIIRNRISYRNRNRRKESRELEMYNEVYGE